MTVVDTGSSVTSDVWTQLFERQDPEDQPGLLVYLGDPHQLIYGARPQFSSEPSTSALSALSSDEWELLRGLVAIRDETEVRHLLTGFPELRALIYELLPRVTTLFGGAARVRLEYLRDDERSDVGELFAVISTSLDPASALRTLSKLDETWWLVASERALGAMNIALDYV